MTDSLTPAERLKRLLFRAAAKSLYGLNLLEHITSPPDWRIVRYRHVVSPETLPYPIERTSYVRPKSFEMQCEYLKSECNTIDLNALLDLLASGAPIPPRTATIVFEGGFRDTYENAFPVLKRFALPAAVFVPTAFAGTENMFWQDKVLRSLLLLGSLGVEFPKFEFLDEEFTETLRSISPEEQINLSTIALLVRELEGRPAEQRLTALAILGSLADQAGGLESERVFLNWAEITEMYQAGIRFGSFGHRHAPFNELPPEELIAEIKTSARTFNEHKIRYSEAVALPRGIVDAEHMEILAKLGVRFLLGSASAPAQHPQILGQRSIYENISFARELFACALWGETLFKLWFGR